MVAAVAIAVTAFLYTLQSESAFAFIAPSHGNTSDIIFARVTELASSSTSSSCQLNSGCQVLQTTSANTSCQVILQCLCTEAVSDAFDSCLQCGVSAGATTKPEVTKNINQFNKKCSESGFPISKNSNANVASHSSSNSHVQVDSTLSSNEPSASVTPTSLSAAASKISISTFGVMLTTVLGTITLLLVRE